MLSKTQFLYFLQCPKYAWLYKNRKDLISSAEDLGYQQIQGESIEFWVYQQYSDGVDCKTNKDISEDIKKTKEILSNGNKIVFQPSFQAGELFCRCDLLIFNESSQLWDLIEIKASTKVEDQHIIDLAFQKQCLTSYGLSIGAMYIYYVNNKYIKKGPIEANKIISKEDVTEKVNFIEVSIRNKINQALVYLKENAEEPDIKILKQCNNPYECNFKPYCWQNIPNHSIYDLSLKEQDLEMLVSEGKIMLEDVPYELVSRKNKKNYYLAKISNSITINKQGIKDELSSLSYPLYFLDYESYNPAVPLFDGLKPYQQMVFQFSLHKKNSSKAIVEHYEFISEQWQDPTPMLLHNLINLLGSMGTIIVWNESFEKLRNKEMGEMYPSFKKQMLNINSRIYDLGVPFKKEYYIHPEFKGSWSIKSILPVLFPDLSYKNINIQGGMQASGSYRRLIDSNIDVIEKDKLKKDMLEYCKLDTLAMVKIYELLEEISY